MVVKTRLSAARPNREERLENAARRCRVRKSIDKAQQEEAFKELVRAMANNGGKVAYGEVDKIVKAYNANGFKAVTRQNLYYRLSKQKKGEDSTTSKTQIVTVVTTGAETEGVISDLTDDQYNNQIASISITNSGSQKKGSARKKKKQSIKTINEVITKCAVLYQKNLKRLGRKA
jgi:hypothetical protein